MGPASHVCDDCGKSFVRRYCLDRHVRTKHGQERVTCEKCGLQFTRRDSYLRHIRNHHPQFTQQQNNLEQVSQSGQQENNRYTESKVQVGAGVPAPPSNETQKNNEENDTSSDQTEKENDIQNQEDDCSTSEEAIDGNLKKVFIEARDKTKYDPMTFLKAKEEKIRLILKDEIKKRQRIKFYITLQVRFTKNKGNQTEITEPYFHGKCHALLKVEDMEEAIRESFMKIINLFIEYQREGSNWTLDKVISVNIHMATYRPMKGNSSFLPLSAKLACKKAIINVQNYDDKCFMWAVLAALHPSSPHAERITHYAEYTDELDFTDISFPMKVCDVSKFEKLNDIRQRVWARTRINISHTFNKDQRSTSRQSSPH